MGLSNSGSQIRYVNIVYGKFALKCEPGTSGSVTRFNKMGQEVHELHYDTLSGRITDVYVNEGEYGKDWLINLFDGESTYALQIPQSIGSSIGVLARLPVVDYSKDVAIKVYYIENKTHLVVYQSGRKLQSAYTKDNPNGLPPLEKKFVDGKEVWDATKRNEYFENMLDKQIKRLIKEANEPEGISSEQQPSEFLGEADHEDLPF